MTRFTTSTLQRFNAVLFACFAVHSCWAAPAPMLIPFQGRLTDQHGVPYTNGQYTITFNLYDVPVGGTKLWSETHQRVGIINGMVNVFLGSINSLTNAGGFDQARHLGITIDADGNPNTPDPEMVPRQMIIPSFWATHSENASKLAGYDWREILEGGSTDPHNALISASRIQTGGITAQQIQDHSITGDRLKDGTITAASISSDLLVNLMPPGVIVPFGGTNVPSGWLLCDGSAVSSIQYAALYSAIRTNWGAGTNSTYNFNLPDLRGRCGIGAGMGGGLSSRSVGEKGGEETHTLTIAEMPSHTHLMDGGYGRSGGDHRYVEFQAEPEWGNMDRIKPAGGDQPHNNMQPFAVLNYIIRY
jgi:microcystin-dependent protein